VTAPTAEGAALILHLVTDRRRAAGLDEPLARARECVLRQIGYAIEAGVDVIQIRERDLDASDLARLTIDAVALARGSRTRIVVNDRIDVALAAAAAGVHLRGDSVPTQAARSIAPRGFLIGRSVHGVDEAIALVPGVDYFIAGTVWSTPSKPERDGGHPPLGEAGLAAIVAAVRVPVLAIGGVTVERAPVVAASGAAGIAAIGLFLDPGRAQGCSATDLRARVDAIRMRFDTSRRAS
jgi:thiamine-phosphate diphosphorylase